MTNSENRVGKKPVPDDVLQYMNPEQLLTYRGMQGFGWYLKFVLSLIHISEPTRPELVSRIPSSA